jgi:hypothetical protein
LESSSRNNWKFALPAGLAVLIVIAAGVGVYGNSQSASLHQNVSMLSISSSELQDSVSQLHQNISELQAQVASLKSENASISVALLTRNSEIDALQQKITVLQAEASKLAALEANETALKSQISSLQSVLNLEVQATLVNQTFSVPVNSSVTVFSFTAQYPGYLLISGNSSEYVYVAVCFGATSKQACDDSTEDYSVGVGQSAAWKVPLMAGPIWIIAFNPPGVNAPGNAIAMISVVEYT